MNWDDLKVFLAIADAKGLKKAAYRLGVHHTSCARRIKRLESAARTFVVGHLPPKTVGCPQSSFQSPSYQKVTFLVLLL